MTSKEIIRRLIEHDAPERLGYDFLDQTDFLLVEGRKFINLPENPYAEWGDYPELKKIANFTGEVHKDVHGNIYGRFNGKTKGECVWGVVQDWDDYEYFIPEFDPTYGAKLRADGLPSCDKYVISYAGSLFSPLRDARLMANALADTITDPDKVTEFVDCLVEDEIKIIKTMAGSGINGWFMFDDWGTQDRTFISPAAFRELFKPGYRRIADAVHEAGMHLFLHSCGYNYAFIEDYIDAGIDVLQFDQPDAYPAEVLAKEFAHRVCFYSPVDIQKVLPTGDRAFIERRALEMCEMFRAAGGGMIIKDYPAYEDIGVEPEWAKWAQNVITANSKL